MENKNCLQNWTVSLLTHSDELFVCRQLRSRRISDIPNTSIQKQ